MRTRSDLRGASAESAAALADRLAAALSSGAADGDRVADDLFAVAALLRGEAALRRVLTDPSAGADAKAGLVRQVLGPRLDATSVDLVAAAAGSRWAASRDLADTVEHLGVVAVVRAADQRGEADALEDQLFRFSRVVADDAGLRTALSDPARSVADKATLLRSLLQGRVTSGTLRLVEQALTGSHRTVTAALDDYQKVAAEERQRMVALVRVARPLRAAEVDRLVTALSAQYGRPVHLNEIVEPDLVGGIRVEIGDDVIDGTLASRLDDARRRLVG